MSRDIVHAQRGFRRRASSDFVNRFIEGEALPMEWEENMHLPTGNEIRFADEILPGGQDEIPAVGGDEIRSCGADGGGDFVNRFTEGEALPMEWDMVELRLIGKRNPGVARTKSCPTGRTKSPPLAGTKSDLWSDWGPEKIKLHALASLEPRQARIK